MNQEERERLRGELAKLGVKGSYLDSWQPKQDGWRHRAGLNVDGVEVSPAGSKVPNMPGNPDTTVRLAVRGIFPYRPSSSCKCKDCRARAWEKYTEDADGCLVLKPKQEPVEVEGGKVLACDLCSYVTKPGSKNRPASLRFHKLSQHTRVKTEPAMAAV